MTWPRDLESATARARRYALDETRARLKRLHEERKADPAWRNDPPQTGPRSEQNSSPGSTTDAPPAEGDSETPASPATTENSGPKGGETTS